MAEMVGLSRGLQRRNTVLGNLFAALKRILSQLVGNGRANRVRLEEWPDYLLRDIGLDGTLRDAEDPRAKPTDWMMR